MPIPKHDATSALISYDEDYHAWVLAQIALRSRTGEEEYRLARRKAAAETGLPISTFPDACPFTTEQVLDPDFLP